MLIDYKKQVTHYEFNIFPQLKNTLENQSIILTIKQDKYVGRGEIPLAYISSKFYQYSEITNILDFLIDKIKHFHPYERDSIINICKRENIPNLIINAIENALLIWKVQSLSIPLWKILSPLSFRIPPTSITIGTAAPQEIKTILEKWRKVLGIKWKYKSIPKFIKLKMGNPNGIEHDKQTLLELKKHIPKNTKICVDVNGKWKVNDIEIMYQWLSKHNIEYIEQLFPIGKENLFRDIACDTKPYIIIDDSFNNLEDLLSLFNSSKFHGINIKLAKCGGILDALSMIAFAKSNNLKVVLGSISESLIGIAPSILLSPLADYVDLDSHLLLSDDPNKGAIIKEGKILLDKCINI